MNTENFILSISKEQPHLSNAQVAALAQVSVADVRRVRGNGPKRVKLAPQVGAAFEQSIEPVTEFERMLDLARRYKTVEDAADSILQLQSLLSQARAVGDVGAEYAVVNTAMVMHYRARQHKPIQAEAFRRFVDRAMAAGAESQE